jgi:hypothetical protein
MLHWVENGWMEFSGSTGTRRLLPTAPGASSSIRVIASSKWKSRGAGLLFLRLLRRSGRLLTAGRHDVLHAHVGGHVTVVLQVMHVVDRERTEPRGIVAEELYHLHRGGVGHAVVGLVAVGEGGIERGDVWPIAAPAEAMSQCYMPCGRAK